MNIQEEWDNCTRMKLFEIEVIDIETCEDDYLIVNVECNNGILSCDFYLDFPFETDTDTSLDYNLIGLYEAITNDRNFTQQYRDRS